MTSGQIPLQVERHRGRRRRWPVFLFGFAFGVALGIALLWPARCA